MIMAIDAIQKCSYGGQRKHESQQPIGRTMLCISTTNLGLLAGQQHHIELTRPLHHPIALVSKPDSLRLSMARAFDL
jgi:hypothetical protein